MSKYIYVDKIPFTPTELPICWANISGFNHLSQQDLVSYGWFKLIEDTTSTPQGQMYTYSNYEVINNNDINNNINNGYPYVLETKVFLPLPKVYKWNQLYLDLIDPQKGGIVYNDLLMKSAFPFPGDTGLSSALATLANTLTGTANNELMNTESKLAALQSAINFLCSVLKDRNLYTQEIYNLLDLLLISNNFTEINLPSIN